MVNMKPAFVGFNPHAVTGIGAIGQQVLSLYGANSEVFDSERFIFGKNIVR